MFYEKYYTLTYKTITLVYFSAQLKTTFCSKLTTTFYLYFTGLWEVCQSDLRILIACQREVWEASAARPNGVLLPFGDSQVSVPAVQRRSPLDRSRQVRREHRSTSAAGTSQLRNFENGPTGWHANFIPSFPMCWSERTEKSRCVSCHMRYTGYNSGCLIIMILHDTFVVL